MRRIAESRKSLPRWPAAAVTAVVAAGCAAAVILPCGTGGGEAREVLITARQYAFEPHRIVVDAGDKLRLRLASQDVVHGLFLEGHDLEAEIRPGKLTFLARRPSAGEGFREVEEVEITTSRPGKYRYRCSISCGTLHPFMQGELVVRPNLVFHAGWTAACATTALFFAFLFSGVAPAGVRRREAWRVDLLARFPLLRRVVTCRWFPFGLILPNLLVLVFFVAAGFLGSPIGNRNVVVTVVWILWWFLLILVLVPFGGRAWCLACPVPFFGEWFARRRLVGVRREAERSSSWRTGGLNLEWPRRLRNLWLPNLLFLVLCSFSTLLVTRPALTSAVLASMVLAAFAVHAVFRRRTFCRYLCPLNAWMSLYAMTAMTEVRARDPELCKSCRTHSCAAGSAAAWRCPWLVRDPPKMTRNNYCGLCMECVKACPNENLTLRARPFASDVWIRGDDEVVMALLMITLVVAYSVTLLGPWGSFRTWTNVTESGDWAGFAGYTAAVALLALVVLPGLWYALAGLGRLLGARREVAAREIFRRYAFVLVPLGLCAWGAFSLPLILVNYTHVTSSLSDPLGWGWDLFGTAGQRWSPLFPEWIPYLQIPLLLCGLAVALLRGSEIARELYADGAAAARSLIPHALFCTAVTLGLLWLYVG